MRRGFTLIELLVVMVITGILAGMIAMAVTSVQHTARVARTKSVIATINEVLITKWEDYLNRPLPLVYADPYGPPLGLSPDQAVYLPPSEAARVRLIMLRDLMRMEMPDRISDVTTNATPISARIYIRSAGATKNTATWGGPTSIPINWWNPPLPSGLNAPAVVSSYRDRMTPTWTPEHESAECLYLILATTSFSGMNALEMLPTTHIGDTDEDGMLEILDAWGNPLGFIRWPVGMYTMTPSGMVDPAGTPVGVDEFDMFQADWGFQPGVTGVMPAFSMRPLVVSPGSDGVFDIRFRQNTEIPYRDMQWPTSLQKMGTDVRNTAEAAGRPSPYYYIDPYLREYQSEGLIGEYLDVDGDGDEQRADNITNIDMQSSL